MYFGAHVKASGGVWTAVERGEALGVHAIQFSSSAAIRLSLPDQPPVLTVYTRCNEAPFHSRERYLLLFQ